MNSLLAILGMGNGELILVLAIVLLLFGATKLPKLARSMGQSVNEFKKGMNEGAEGTPADKDSKSSEKPEKS